MSKPKVLVFLPCYKRPEYTSICIDSLRKVDYPKDLLSFYLVDDGSQDGTDKVLLESGLNGVVIVQENKGLRTTQIEFFEYAMKSDSDIFVKCDNDCVFPPEWILKAVDLFSKTDVGILSPNVFPSNAAFVHGKDDKDNVGYRPSEIVGGLWMMRREVLDGMYFEKHNTNGLTGAIPILKQICLEKDPKVGWMADVIVQDIGHWSGKHPLHIKSFEHERYSKSVGRAIAWRNTSGDSITAKRFLEEDKDDF